MRKHSAPSEHAGQAPASLTSAREALGKSQIGSGAATLGQKVRGQPGSGWLHPEQRCFHWGCCSCLISLKWNLSYQNPVSSKADSCCSSSNSSSLQVCILCQDTSYCRTMILKSLEQRSRPCCFMCRGSQIEFLKSHKTGKGTVFSFYS